MGFSKSVVFMEISSGSHSGFGFGITDQIFQRLGELSGAQRRAPEALLAAAQNGHPQGAALHSAAAKNGAVRAGNLDTQRFVARQGACIEHELKRLRFEQCSRLFPRSRKSASASALLQELDEPGKAADLFSDHKHIQFRLVARILVQWLAQWLARFLGT